MRDSEPWGVGEIGATGGGTNSVIAESKVDADLSRSRYSNISGKNGVLQIFTTYHKKFIPLDAKDKILQVSETLRTKSASQCAALNQNLRNAFDGNPKRVHVPMKRDWA
jgi:hypothetical protein